MKKIERAKSLIGQHLYLFVCPICHREINRQESNSLICANHHCFDLSRYGYIHFLAKPVKPSKYDQPMFAARQAICQSGFFAEVNEQIRQIVSQQRTTIHPQTVVDVGCGEGSHLADLIKGLNRDGMDVLGVGIDLSKEGIRIAARDNPGLIWCVADLAQSPFRANQFDVILNIFSPANYREFTRILADEGSLVKIVQGYLAELRSLFYRHREKEAYSNEQVVAHFSEQFHLVDTRYIKVAKRVNPTDLTHLIHMTPLAWGATEQQIQQALQSGLSSVTIDVTMMVGKKKKR